MVARTNTHERIDIQLRAIEAALADLPEIVEEWEELPDGERASWSLDWDHLMGSYLIILDRYHTGAEMSEEQNRRYHALRDCLRAALPLIDRLNLYRPPISLD
jgi:hypothetical protein